MALRLALAAMVAGRRASPLVWRVPLQVFRIGALWWIA